MFLPALPRNISTLGVQALYQRSQEVGTESAISTCDLQTPCLCTLCVSRQCQHHFTSTISLQMVASCVRMLQLDYADVADGCCK